MGRRSIRRRNETSQGAPATDSFKTQKILKLWTDDDSRGHSPHDKIIAMLEFAFEDYLKIHDPDEALELIHLHCMTRACPSHGRRPCAPAARLHIAWPGLYFIVRDSMGQETECQSDVIVQAGSEILFRIATRERSFSLGEIVQFSPDDITEICYMVTRDARELVECLTGTARKLGIPISVEQ